MTLFKTNQGYEPHSLGQLETLTYLMKSTVQKGPQNYNAVNIKTIRNLIKQDKFKNQRESDNDLEISKTRRELSKTKSGFTGADRLNKLKEIYKPVIAKADTIKLKKLRNQTEYSNNNKVDKTRVETSKLNKAKCRLTQSATLKKPKKVCKADKTRAETTKFNKATNRLTQSATLKKPKDVCRSVITKKQQNLKKQSEHCKVTKVGKSRSECIKPGTLINKGHKSTSDFREDSNTKSTFNFVEALLACGDFCFQQKKTVEDIELVTLYENYSYREKGTNNMAPDEINEEPKETPKENPDEPENAGGEQEAIEPPTHDVPAEEGGEQETIEPPTIDVPAEDSGKQEVPTTDNTEPPTTEVPAEAGGEHELTIPPPADMTAEAGGEQELTVPPPADVTAEDSVKETTVHDKVQEPQKPKAVSFDENAPHTDSEIQEVLQAAKAGGVLTTKAIEDLQKSVIKLTQKDHLTYEEAVHLQKTQADLLSKLSEFEEITRRVVRAMQMTEVPSSQLDMTMPFFYHFQPAVLPNEPVKEESSAPAKQVTPKRQFSEEKLPNIIVCGTGADDNVPKIIVCRPMMDCDTQPFLESQKYAKDPGDKISRHRPSGIEGEELPKRTESNSEILLGLIKRVDGCLSAQQRMFNENMQLEQSRYEMQMEIIRKDQIVEDLQKKVNALQNEMHATIQENTELKKQALLSFPSQQPPMCRKQLYEQFAMKDKQTGSGSGETDEDTQREVKPTCEAGEKAVHTVQDESSMYKQHDNFPTIWGQPICKLMLPSKETQTDGLEFDPVFISEANPDYKTLYQQYLRMQIDYRNKVSEISSLWNELQILKQELNKKGLLLKQVENLLEDEKEINKHLEEEKQELLLYRDQYLDLEQQTNLTKHKLREIEEEGDNARQVLVDQTSQLETYRAKLYEEIKQEMEQRDKNYNEKLVTSDQQMKEKEEEYLEEIKVLRTRLQDVQRNLEDKTHLHSIALDNITELSTNIQGLTIENEQLKIQMYNLSNEDKVNRLQSDLEATEMKLEEIQLENAKLRSLTNRLETMQSENNRRFEEKSHENRQLVTQLETLREETARQVVTIKDRWDSVKKTMQVQINDMETELIQTRAALSAAKKDREEIRQKLQLQIMNLNDSFGDAQIQIEQLLNCVVFLKTSYTRFMKAGGGNVCSSVMYDEERASAETLCGS